MSAERGTVAAGRQDSAGHRRHLEEEIQDGSGDCTAGSSVAFRGRFVGEKVRRSEGGICHLARGIMPYLNKISFDYRKLIYVDEIVRSYVCFAKGVAISTKVNGRTPG